VPAPLWCRAKKEAGERPGASAKGAEENHIGVRPCGKRIRFGRQGSKRRPKGSAPFFPIQREEVERSVITRPLGLPQKKERFYSPDARWQGATWRSGRWPPKKKNNLPRKAWVSGLPQAETKLEVCGVNSEEKGHPACALGPSVTRTDRKGKKEAGRRRSREEVKPTRRTPPLHKKKTSYPWKCKTAAAATNVSVPIPQEKALPMKQPAILKQGLLVGVGEHQPRMGRSDEFLTAIEPQELVLFPPPEFLPCRRGKKGITPGPSARYPACYHFLWRWGGNENRPCVNRSERKSFVAGGRRAGL